MADLIEQYRADAERIKARRDKLKGELMAALRKGDEDAAFGLRKRIRDLDSMHYNLMLAVQEMSKGDKENR